MGKQHHWPNADCDCPLHLRQQIVALQATLAAVREGLELIANGDIIHGAPAKAP